MSRLIIVISDLYPQRQSFAGMPRLACLEQWLARGGRERLPRGWQQWLLETCFAGRFASLPWAQVAGAALNLDARSAWLATPVHLLAGIDTVRLHPAGLLHLELAEQQLLASDFATVFHDSEWSMHATAHRELLLCSDTPRGGRSSDPARWLGADPSPGLVSGPEAGAVRRLGAELEMWLHEHPVNRARSSAGQLTITGLWLWGGPPMAADAVLAPTPLAPTQQLAAAAPLQVFGADLFLEGLCRLGGAASHALPSWPPSGPTGRAAKAIVHVTLGNAPDSAALLALERDLIAPLTRQWRRGDWESLTLLVGEQAVTLRRAGWRVWRAFTRTRPWWESLLG